MAGWLGAAHPWVLAAHIIFVMFFVAGLLIFARHLAYQSVSVPGSGEDGQWVERIALLKRVILNPSIIAVWVLGLMLAANLGFEGGWLHLKILLVLLLSGYHGWLVGQARKMANGHRPHGDKVYRRTGEIPAIITVLVVILVVVRPF